MPAVPELLARDLALLRDWAASVKVIAVERRQRSEATGQRIAMALAAGGKRFIRHHLARMTAHINRNEGPPQPWTFQAYATSLCHALAYQLNRDMGLTGDDQVDFTDIRIGRAEGQDVLPLSAGVN